MESGHLSRNHGSRYSIFVSNRQFTDSDPPGQYFLDPATPPENIDLVIQSFIKSTISRHKPSRKYFLGLATLLEPIDLAIQSFNKSSMS